MCPLGGEPLNATDPPLTAWVFVGGDPPGLAAADLPAATLTVAADSGADHARSMGVLVDVVVGDLDSITAGTLGWAQEHEAEFVTFPQDKNATDLELALRLCMERGAGRIVVVGGLGGRVDHQMGNLLLMAHEDFARIIVELHAASTVVQVIRSHPVALHATAGNTVSLFPVAGPIEGLSTHGFHWELSDATVPVGSTWTVSNVARSDHPTVDVASGVLLAVTTGA